MEDDFFPLQSHSGWHVQPSARSAGQVLLGRALKGMFLRLPAALVHPVCCSSWWGYVPAEHLLLCAGACVGVRAYVSVHVEEAQVRAFGLADMKSALVRHIVPFIADVLQQS